MQYLIQTTVYAALMYAVYVFVLKDRAQHNWSRLYLLAASVLPLLMPFITISAFAPKVVEGTVLAEVTAPAIIVTNKIKQVPMFSWYAVLRFTYSGIVVLLLGRLLWQYLALRNLIKKHTVQKMEGASLVLNTGLETGSWGNYILIPGNEIDNTVLAHELAHVELKHSYDIICIRLLQCIFWPNILLYIIEKELRTVHEFQADALVKVNKEEYAQTLLNHVFNTQQFSLAHTFFHKPIKRRITMLGKQSSASLRTRIAIITGLITIILVVGIISLQGCKKQQASTSINSNNGEQVYDMVDIMPTTTYDLADYMSKNIFYPQSAKENKIEGRVTIKFVVDKNGNVVNPQVLGKPDTLLTSAALYAINHMPKWEPFE